MAKRYIRVNSGQGWENAPSVATPINKSNLNIMDKGIDDLDLYKIDTDAIANNLVTTEAGLVLDARQGKVLDGKVNELTNNLDSHLAENVTQQEVHGLRIEKGTWTPVLVGSTVAGTHTYSQQVGRYTKINNLVYISMRLAITTIDSNASGDLNIAGLPFIAISQDTGLTLSSYTNIQLGDEVRQILARTLLNTSRIDLVKISIFNFLPGPVALNDIATNPTGEIRLSGVYETN